MDAKNLRLLKVLQKQYPTDDKLNLGIFFTRKICVAAKKQRVGVISILLLSEQQIAGKILDHYQD